MLQFSSWFRGGKTLQELVALGRALFHTETAGCAFAVIRNGNAVCHIDAVLRAGTDAGFALDTVGFACFDNRGFRGTPVAAEYDRP